MREQIKSSVSERVSLSALERVGDSEGVCCVSFMLG